MELVKSKSTTSPTGEARLAALAERGDTIRDTLHELKANPKAVISVELRELVREMQEHGVTLTAVAEEMEAEEKKAGTADGRQKCGRWSRRRRRATR